MKLKEHSRFTVAGLQYYDYQLLGSKLKAGAICKFVWEPRNKYDKNAIRIDVAGVKIGYVPAGKTHEYHQLRVQGRKIRASIAAVNKTNPTWYMVTVKVEAEEAVTKDVSFEDVKLLNQ